MMARAPGDAAGIDTSLVECLVIAVPEMASFSTVVAAVGELVETAAIRVLDLVVVTRQRSDHEVRVVEPRELDALPAQVLVARQPGGLLSENDIALAATGLLPGAVGLVLLLEDRWAGSLSTAAKGAGGLVLGGERISRARIEAALVEAPVEPDRPTPPARPDGRGGT